jgi:hypothetical protein
MSILFLVIVLAGAAFLALLLARVGRGTVDVARLTTVFAVLTIVGAAFSAVVACWSLLFASQAEVTVPLTVTQARFPEGIIDPHTVATVVSGGADRAALVVSGLTLPTRLLLLGADLAGAVTIGAVAVVALRAARALRRGDIFAFAPRAIMATATIVIAGGLTWSLLGDIGAWRASVEALHVYGFGAEGALAQEMANGSAPSEELLAEHGWLAPAGLTVTFPLWPLGLALVGSAFRAGQDLRKDVTELKADVDGLI